MAENEFPNEIYSKKVTLHVSKKTGIVLSRTKYLTKYKCDLCGNDVICSKPIVWEDTKNSDIRMRCNWCRNVMTKEKRLENLERLLIGIFPEHMKDELTRQADAKAKRNRKKAFNKQFQTQEQIDDALLILLEKKKKLLQGS